MADWSKGTINIDGEAREFTLPEYSRESTQADMLKALSKLAGLTTEEVKTLDEVLKETKNRTKTSKEEKEILKTGFDKLTKVTQERNEKEFEGFEKGFTKAGGALGKSVSFVAKTLSGVFLASVTVVTGKFNQLGQVFNDLTKQGLAFDEAQGMSVMGQIKAFNQLGMSTEEAANFMMDTARATRTLQGGLVNQLEQFQDLTKFGGALGMTLEDSVKVFGEEINRRTQYLGLGQLNAQQLSNMNKGIADTVKKQVKFAQALGVSTEEIQGFVDSVLGQNGTFASALLRMPEAARDSMLKGATDFVGTMRALGGQVGGELGAATLEAATFGAIGFSDAAANFMMVLPSMADTMNKAISEFEAGTLDGADMAQQFAGQLGNLSQMERDRVFAFARAGDETAKELAKAVVAFEQSEKRLKQMNKDLNINGVQAGFNAFNTILKRIGTIFDEIINTFAQGFGEGIGDISGSLQNLQNNIIMLINKLVGGILNAEEGLLGFSKAVGKKTAEFIDYLNGMLTALVDSNLTLQEFGNIVYDSTMNMLEKFGDALVDGLVNALEALFTHPKVVGAFAALLAMSMNPFGGKGKGSNRVLQYLGLSSLVSEFLPGSTPNTPPPPPPPPPTPTPTGPGGKTPMPPGTILGADGKPINTAADVDTSKTKTNTKAKNLIKGGARVAGKILWPLAVFTAVSDAVDGYQNAGDGTEGTMEKLGNSLEAVASGLTFGLIGDSASEQREKKLKRADIQKNLASTPISSYDPTNLDTLKDLREKMTGKDKDLYKDLVAQILDKSAVAGQSTGGTGGMNKEERAGTFTDDKDFLVLRALDRLIKLQEKNNKTNKEIADNV